MEGLCLCGLLEAQGEGQAGLEAAAGGDRALWSPALPSTGGFPSLRLGPAEKREAEDQEGSSLSLASTPHSQPGSKASVHPVFWRGPQSGWKRQGQPGGEDPCQAPAAVP